MKLYKKLLKMIEADLPIYDNVEYAKDLAEIAKAHYKKQFSLNGVVKSFYCENQRMKYRDDICLRQCGNCKNISKTQ
jgi:hypothetical protein